jgi:hypothetical protein
LGVRVCGFRFWVAILGFWDWGEGWGFGVWGSGLGVWGLGLEFCDWIWGRGFTVQGSGFRVQGSGSAAYGTGRLLSHQHPDGTSLSTFLMDTSYRQDRFQNPERSRLFYAVNYGVHDE